MNIIETSEKPDPGTGQTKLPEFESKQQLAARLSVSSRTIDNLMVRGLPYTKLTGKLVRFSRAATNDWLAHQQIRRA